MLHLVIMVLSISVLAGITFEYDTPNAENEVILLVDTSESGEESRDAKDEFVKSVIDNGDSMFKLGIVTFGYDQVYAAELTNDMGSIYAKYLQAESPDNSATDIASALSYAAGLFESPETARIVLITDAVETDGDASTVIKSIAAQGIKVDTVHFPEEELGDEVQLIEMTTPEEKIKVGENFSVQLTVQSSYTGKATITPYDNDIAGASIEINVTEGIQTVEIPYVFTLPGMHKMSFEMASEGDTLIQNNLFNSYIYLEIFDKILVIESIESESESLCGMLRDELNVDIVNVADVTKMPDTLDELRAYDEVILCNISNSDMPTGFDEILYSYVHDIGGGLFTICGNEQDANPNDDDWTANAYTKDDMFGSLYQQMLPVEAINYTPPVAVMIIIDCSGSMYDPNSGPEENSKLGYAKKGAEACLDALTERDYVGIMSLSEDFEERIELTPRPQRNKILSAIESISVDGGTVFSGALERAGKALAALTAVEKRHIILVTDAEPVSSDTEKYLAALEENAKMGITISIVGVQASASAKNNMIDALEDHAGMTADNYHDVADIQSVPEIMRGDLEVDEIKDVNYTTFQPTVKLWNSVTAGLSEAEVPFLDGFYGLKAKEGAQVILMGEYTPIYTQWQFGKGTVGTFACDLNGTWSSKFIDTPFAETLLNNIVQSAFPTENIRPVDIELEASGKNYSTNLSVFTDMAEGEYIEVTVKSPAAEGETEGKVQTITTNPNESYSRLQFTVKTPGIHEIKATKKAADGTVISEAVTYKALSYSQEYNAFTDPEVASLLIAQLAADGNGEVIEDPWMVFANAAKYLHRVIDPKLTFMIIALVLFLLDIAARKFKWKWPHEIIRERKARAEMNR